MTEPDEYYDVLEVPDSDEDESGTVEEPPRPRGVVIEIKDFATGNTQSFSVMTGDTLQVTLTGYISDGSRFPRVLSVPLTIKAHLT